MKKSTKISGSILTQSGLFETSFEANSDELKTLSDKDKKNKEWFGNALDFLSNGKFSIRNQNIKFRVFKNRVKIETEARELIEDSGLPITPLDLKVQKSISENSQLEENPILQNKWSNMIANALTKKVEVTNNNSIILSQLNESEVLILDKIYAEAIDQELPKKCIFDKNAISEVFKISIDRVEIIFDNFLRLRLIKNLTANVPGMVAITQDMSKFNLTPLGFHFIESYKFDNTST
jgi:hypothetical protein